MKDSEPFSTAQQFERFVYNLAPFLLSWNHSNSERPQQNGGVDAIFLGPDGEVVLIEVKSYTPSTKDRLQALVKQLRLYSEHLQTSAIYLAVPGVLDAAFRHLLETNGVGLWDGPILKKAAEDFGVAVPPEIKLAAPTVSLVKPPGLQLIRRLNRLESGNEDWRPYQQWCTDALAYLFHPPLEAPFSEHANSSKVNRRDILLPNYSTDGFWAFMRTHYKADFVVADAKNHSAPVKKNDILQLANYLTAHGPGLFGIITTRIGHDDGAEWTRREQWTVYNKLIIVLTDEDMRQMLSARDAGDEAEATIRQRIEDFRLSL